MPDFPRHLQVQELFGQLSPSVKLRLSERITILAGPNGSGKTHVLRILRNLLSPNLVGLARLPFSGVELEYESGNSLRVSRKPAGSTAEIELRGELASGRKFATEAPYIVQVDPPEGMSLPPYIQRIDDDNWVDARDGELLVIDEVIERYGRLGAHPYSFERIAGPGDWPPDWIRDHFTGTPPTFIATARLDVSPASGDVRGPVGTTNIRQPRLPGTAARILQYVNRIRDQVAEARRASLAVSQRADQEFASRALDKARETVKERELHDRYEGLATLHQELHANGLTAESLGVSFPSGKTNPTERRILNVFLSDWEDKLAPLNPVHEKLQLLREIVGEKLRGKTLAIENDEPKFHSPTGDPISVEMLSSGEQHLLALFTMLLFAAERGSVVLIDEPEISLHASWKHAFLEDIARVAAINDLQVVLATHSTAIINGRWELVEELSLAE